MKKFLANLLVIAFFLLFALPSFAQYNPVNYNYSILIDKTVATHNDDNTNSNNYVDNLSPSDSRFHAGNDVYFKIRVKNTSNRNLNAVWVKDFVPTYILPLEGPGGWNVDNRTISWNAGDFNVDEEKTYYLKMRVYDNSLLPSDKGLICVTNNSEARNDVAYDDDAAQICIEKPGTSTATTTYVGSIPKTGPEMGIALFGVEAALFGLGIYLKKRA